MLVILGVQTFAIAALAAVLVARGGGVHVTRVVAPAVIRTVTAAAAPSAGPERSSMFRPLADGYVRATSAMSSYGRNAELRIDGSPVARAYIRFNIIGDGRRIRRATLRLYSLTTSESGVEVSSAGSGWSESSLSFRDAPPLSAGGVPSGPLIEHTWTDVDVTTLVRTGGDFTLALVGLDPKELAVASRENVRFGPRLVVEFLQSEAKRPARRLQAASPGGKSAVLIAAGDIASCASVGDDATAALLDRLPGTVAPLGDNAYESGTAEEFARCYGPTWGRQKARTHPAPGNHDYRTPSASGYFGYFGAAAGDPAKGYYSYALGRWHVVVLNSNCAIVACRAGSEQERWLREDLRAHPVLCTLAYWHHPRFSSGQHGDDPSTGVFWRDLYAAGADVVLAGHDHDYERFVPVDPDGRPDSAHGITEFVVGTGGKNHYRMTRAALPTSVVRNDETFGVLKLTLRATGYSWRFVPVAGASFSDSGSAVCH